MKQATLDSLTFEGARQRLALAGGLPREPTNEMGNIFERKDAAKRNVANRPLQALFGVIATSNYVFSLKANFLS